MTVTARIADDLLPLARSLARVRTDPQNVRRHDERNIRSIMASLTAHGQRKPIVVAPDGTVLAGNGTLEAARRLGWDSLAATVYDASPSERRAFALADNHTAALASWDDEGLASTLRELESEGLLDATGFDADGLAEALATADALSAGTAPADAATRERARSTAVPEVREGPPDSSDGSVYRLGPHALYCGSSLQFESWERLEVTASNRADCAFTSPPYAVGIDYGPTYDDTMRGLRNILDCLPSVLQDLVVPGGFAVLNFGDVVSGRELAGATEPCEYPMALEYYPRFLRDFGVLWARRVWCKPHARCSAPWTAQTNRAATDFEHLWTFKRPGPAIVGRTPESPYGWVDTSRGAGVDVGQDVHGAGMALELPLKMIEVHSRPNSLVLEPFGGTGTTLIAADLCGRRCAVVEINPAFCDVIRRRWTAHALATGRDPGPGALD